MMISCEGDDWAGMMVNNQYRTSHMIIWSYHCGTIMRMRAVKAKSELSYYLFPRIFWFPLQPWSLCPVSSLSWLWADMRCPLPCPWCHHFLSLSLRDTRHVTWHSSRVTRGLSVESAGRVFWHRDIVRGCDIVTIFVTSWQSMKNTMVSLESREGLFYEWRGASIFVK